MQKRRSEEPAELPGTHESYRATLATPIITARRSNRIKSHQGTPPVLVRRYARLQARRRLLLELMIAPDQPGFRLSYPQRPHLYSTHRFHDNYDSGLAPFFVPVVVLVSWVIEPLLWPPGQKPPGRGCPGRCGDVRRCSVGATPLFSPERPPKTRTNFR